ncbi:MAG: 3'-5' exonuclease, partial [Burkholderiales bacterium]
AKLCGFPGKLGMDGSKVWQAFQDGEIVAIRNYCETDVANTYLIFLRFQLMRGHATRDQHDQEVKLARETLSQMDGAHWREYISAWK